MAVDTPLASRPRRGLVARLADTGVRHDGWLDGVRAVAVLFVFIRHSWGLSGSPVVSFVGADLRPLIVMMSNGVDLFFVLSGVLLARSFLRADFQGRPAPRLLPYLAARILRIGPPYWVVLVLVVFLFTPQFIPEARVVGPLGARIFGAHMLFLQTAYLPSFGAYIVETPFWTLTIEMIFYLVLPVAVIAFLRRRWVASLPLALGVSLGWLWFVRNSAEGIVSLWGEHSKSLGIEYPEPVVRFFLSHQFPAFAFHFAVGISVANALEQRRLGHRSRLLTSTAGACYLGVGIVVVLYFMRLLGWDSLVHGYADPIQYMKSSEPSALLYYYLEGIPFAAGFGLIVLGLGLGPLSMRRLAGVSWLAFWGVVGYSVYLLHMPILWKLTTYGFIAEDVDPQSHFRRLAVVGLFCVGVLATGFFLAVERPSIRWAHSWRNRLQNGPDERPSLSSAPEVDAVSIGVAP